MNSLGITRTPVLPTAKVSWFGLGEMALRGLLVVSLPITAVIFAIQSF